MRITFYYRCADERLVAAKQQDNEKGIAVQEAGAAFAKLFNALPLYTQGFNPHFAGLMFNKGNPPANWHLWTQPTQENPVMLPRSEQAVPKRLKQLAKETQEKFRTAWPTEAATPYHSFLLAAMGISPEAVMGNALSYFYLAQPDGTKVSWIGSTLPLDGQSLAAEGEEGVRLDGWYEVLASDFAIANDDFQRVQWEKEHGPAVQPAANEGEGA